MPVGTPVHYVKDFTVQVGGTLIKGALVPIVQQGKKTKSKKHLATVEGKRVKQKYVDDRGCLYDRVNLVYVSAETSEIITKEEYEEAHLPEELPKNILSFAVHEKPTLNLVVPSNTRPYALKPRSDKYNELQYDALFKVLAQEDMVLLSYGVVRDSEGLFRIYAWNGRLVIRKMESPENIMELSFRPSGTAGLTDVAMMRQQIASMVAEPDLRNYRDRHLQRLTDLAQGGTVEYEQPGVSVFKEDMNRLIG